MDRIDELMNHLQRLESEVSEEIRDYKKKLSIDFDQKRHRFEEEVIAQQKRFKMGVLKYLWTADIRSYLVAPLIYAMIVPLVLLDFFVSLYHAIGFSLLRIEKIKRSDYIIFDRNHLAYLNIFEKINCGYCSYANGLIAYTREIAGKTEQYWCPIKHAKKAYLTHPYYKNFIEYGDADSYQMQLNQLRKQLGQIKDN